MLPDSITFLATDAIRVAVLAAGVCVLNVNAVECSEPPNDPHTFTVDGDFELIIWAPPFQCQLGHAHGEISLSLSPPERLFVYRPQSLMLARNSVLLCTIPWSGDNVLLKWKQRELYFRKSETEPWRLYRAQVPDVAAVCRLGAMGPACSPYSVVMTYPIDPAIIDGLRTSAVKEVTVNPRPNEDDEPAQDVIDLTPLCGLKLDSLILTFGGYGRPVLTGLDKLHGLQALAIRCFKKEHFPLAMLASCSSIRYLNVFASNLDCWADPRVFPNLAYCRITAGNARGIRRLAESVTASTLHLDIFVGLNELERDAKLNTAIKHLMLEGSFDLRDISCIKAATSLEELRILGCRWVQPADGFTRPPTEHRTTEEHNLPL